MACLKSVHENHFEEWPPTFFVPSQKAVVGASFKKIFILNRPVQIVVKMINKNDFLDNYMSDFTSRVVNKTGIPSDRYHLGKLILQGFKDDPHFVLQINGGTSEYETNGSVLRRSVQCAASFRNMGLKTGDVMILMAPNHLDQAIPFYAALYLGIAIAPIDRTFLVDELKKTFEADKPKIIFCQSERVQDVQKAVEVSGLDAKIITFDKSEHTMCFSDMMEKYGENMDVTNFWPANFDPEQTIAFLIATSGTTGLPKAAAITHKNAVINGPHAFSFSNKFPTPTKLLFIVMPLQWMTGLLNYFLAPLLKFAYLQTSKTITPEHAIELIKKYKPTLLNISPTMMYTWLKAVDKDICDFTCFEVIYIGGSAVPDDLLEQLKAMAPKAEVTQVLGMSELCSCVFHSPGSPLGSVGIRFKHLQYKLVNVENGEEIEEPNKPGELWLKGPGVFKGYYNNREATTEVFTDDGWFKSGDVMYRDESWRFYYVERIKLLLKLRFYVDDHNFETRKVSPLELESVIRQHPGVLDVAVAGVPDPEYGDMPCACIVPRPGATLTEQEIKDLVKEKLTHMKQLRGGVMFVNELPLTTSTKIHRRKLKEMVIAHARQQSC